MIHIPFKMDRAEKIAPDPTQKGIFPKAFSGFRDILGLLHSGLIFIC